MSGDETKTTKAFPTRLFFAVMVVTLLLLVFVAAQVWTAHKAGRKSAARHLQMESLTNRVIYLDEVLTMSARLGSATGEKQWEDRYRSFEPKLDAAIAQLIEVAPDAFKGQDSAAVDAANAKLVEMENEAFTFVREGNPEKACDVLCSAEYIKNKKIYANDMSRVAGFLKAAITSGQSESNRNALRMVLIISLAILLLTIAWPVVLFQVEKHVTQRNQATQALQESVRQIEKQTWLKTRQGELNDSMRGEQGADELAQNIVANIAHILNCPIGAMYLVDTSGTLKMAGRYAFTLNKDSQITIKPGQGLAGQAAVEKQVILTTDVPKNYLEVTSALGRSAPSHMIVLPFVYEGRVMGVAELGSFDPFADRQIEFLETTAESVAIAIHTAQSRSRTADLLHKTQQQAEELRQQQEELLATTEAGFQSS